MMVGKCVISGLKSELCFPQRREGSEIFFDNVAFSPRMRFIACLHDGSRTLFSHGDLFYVLWNLDTQ